MNMHENRSSKKQQLWLATNVSLLFLLTVFLHGFSI